MSEKILLYPWVINSFTQEAPNFLKKQYSSVKLKSLGIEVEFRVYRGLK